MTLAIDPSLRGLDDCGCCAGVTGETPALITNRPGLAAIMYRIGQQATFKRSMLASLSATDNARLLTLATREDDDFSIALLDAWATTLDVLTFYQERIANESYLRTATERISLLYLARLIGYELRPGVAANSSLAFTLDGTPGAPQSVTIDVGVKAQSVPGPGEQPQLFETVEQIEARAAWNAIKPRLTAPQTLSAGMSTLWLQGADTTLKTGDVLLIVAPASGGYTQALRRIASVTRDDTANRTQLALEAPSYGPVTATTTETGVWVMRAKAAPFGHNAPLRPDPTTPADLTLASEWYLDEADSKRITLDVVYDQIRQGSRVVIDRPNSIFFWLSFEPVLFGARAASLSNSAALSIGLNTSFFFNPRRQIFTSAQQVRTLSRADYGVTARATELTLADDWLNLDYDWSLSLVRGTVVYAQSEQLTPGDVPLMADVQSNLIELNGDYSGLQVGHAIVVSGQLAGSAKDSPIVSEVAVIDKIATSGGITTLTLQRNLQQSYRRDTVAINANVARATHGESVSEVLGSGNGGQPYQRFALRRAPLTYVGAKNPAGAETTLQVRVNDVLWHEAPTLYGHGPSERIYMTRADDAGKATVQFGDGGAGARLPSGTENVRASYRAGIGAAGNVKAGQLSLLMTRPLGVREVVNPEPATGGADRESRDDARRNAPLTVITLDRIVSLRDYEDFARAFGGIAKALATWTWDGQTRGVFVTVAGINGAAVADDSETLANLIDAMKVAGDPYVPLRVQSYLAKTFVLAAAVTKNPDYQAERVALDVRQALLAQFSFDARTFGQPVALSEVMAVMQAVPGVVAVDVNLLRRADFVGGDGLLNPLPAAAPQAGAGSAVLPAELLTLDPAGIQLTVQ
jgi:molybdopterin converting factor small subunit